MMWVPFTAGVAVGLFVVCPIVFFVFCWVCSRLDP